MIDRKIKLGLVVVGTAFAIQPTLSWMERELPKPFIRERITVGKVAGKVEQIHRARYRFAAQYCAGKKVADIAAGEGYGTAMLREVAASVDPYDKEPFGDNILIDLDKQKWDRRYDVIVSLETMEHLARPEFFLANIRDTANLAIISTPVNEGRGANPHHKQSWTTAELKSLLERFLVCEYHSQDNDALPIDDNPKSEMVAVCRPNLAK